MSTTLRLAALAVGLLLAAAPAAATTTGDSVPVDSAAAGFCDATLIGTALRAPDFAPATQKKIDEDIAIARAALAIAPDREDSYFWLGRRLGYAGRFCEAVDVFTRGLAVFPDSYALLRYRGRHLARVRQFDLALADYQRAMDLMSGQLDYFEPDGLPNRIGLTLGTYKSNIIYYHAQTSFAVGDYHRVVEGMARSYTLVPVFSRDDMLPPTAYWTYLAYRKLGMVDEARRAVADIPADLQLVENAEYYRAVQMMQGRISPDDLADSSDSTIKFAVAMERRFNGEEAEAKRLLREIVDDSAQGHWPAESELLAPDRMVSN
ncbi:tetratricopeptide repeat protein [Sphingorhabdus soli]|uniref:Tetratricopeptide repeat protein n=1 Tax=Flavisphingopyxis soli TaxID=2601267 RepID=A0A5C6UML3_9SPHN|nr:tetratricopeptide repeat protein [Sphingorhabdus soli]TXC73770.1 tetratricopeptide repeat protein [Sphingorhabdus soli]